MPVDGSRMMARLDVAASATANLQRIAEGVTGAKGADDATALDRVGKDRRGLVDSLVLALRDLIDALDDLFLETLSGLVHVSTFPMSDAHVRLAIALRT